MVRRLCVALACGVVLGTVVSSSSRADDPKPNMPDQAAMEKAWMEAMTPGEEHKKMAAAVGEWTTVVEDMTMGGEGVKSEGKAKFTMILDGRYLQQEFHGAMGGQEFHGIGITGFDNMTKSFQEIWIDSMGTAIHFSSGKRLDDSTIETKGKMNMPGMGEVMTRSVAKHPDKDHMVFEMYGPGMDGKEGLWMRISYTRKK